MADRVELQIVTNGLQEATSGLERLEAYTKKKYTIKTDLGDAQKLVHDLRVELDKALAKGDTGRIGQLNKDIETARGLVADYQRDYNKVNSEIATMQSRLSSATSEMKHQESAVKSTASATQQVVQEQAKVTEETKKSAAATQDDWKARAEAVKEAVRQAAETARARDEAEKAAKAAEEQRYSAQYAAMEERNKTEAAKMAADEIIRQDEAARRMADEEAEAAAEAQRLADAAAAAEARFQAVLSVIDGIGNALSVASSVTGGVVDFGQGIWDSIGFAGGLFNFSVIDKALDTVTSMITQNLTGNLDRITSRYDIMSTFGQYMSLMGVSQADADRAMSRINESILGLPIGLDEAMYRLRRYQMFMGDIGRATNFTIGIQRAIMAGGANESMRNMSYNQIERLLTTGELTTKRQWMSLLNGLGVSIQFIAEELGYAGMNGKELAGALYSGKITADEFLGAITSLGEGTSDAAKRLDQALSIYKGTIESWTSNIEFAFVRGGQKLLSAVDTALKVNTNTSIIGYMEQFRNAINTAFSGSVSWVEHNPQAFTSNLAALNSLFESLQVFNVGRIATKGFGYIADFIEAVANSIGMLDHTKTEDFIAFAATVAGPLAGFSKIAGPLAIAEGVIRRVSKLNLSDLMGKIVSQMNRVADATEGFLNHFSDEQLSDIMAFSIVYGPMLVKAFELLSSAVRGLRSALEGMHTLWGATEGLRNLWSGMFAPGASVSLAGLGASAAVIGGVIAVIQRFNNQKLEAKKVLHFDDMEEYVSKLNSLIDSIHSTEELHEDTLARIGNDADRAEELLNKINSLNDKVNSGDETAKPILAAAVEQFNDLFPELQLNLDSTTGALDANSAAVAQNASAYAEAIEKVRGYNEAQSYLQTLDSQRRELRARITGLKATRDFYHDSIEQIMRDNGYYLPEDASWFQDLWHSLTTGLINFADGTDATIKALGEGYAQTDAEITVATAELDGLNLTMQQASESLHEQEEAISDSAEATRMMTDASNDATAAQQGLAGMSESVAAAFEAQSEAITNLIERYKELKTESYEALHSALASFEEIKPPDKDYDFGGVLEQNAALMGDYRDATAYIADLILQLQDSDLADTIAAQGLTVEDAYTYLADVLKNGDVYKTIGVAERAMGSMDTFISDAKAYAKSLENADIASTLSTISQLFVSGDKEGLGYALLTGAIQLPTLEEGDGEAIEAWVNSLREGQGLLDEIFDKYGYDPITGSFLNADTVEEYEAAWQAIDDFTKQYLGEGEDSNEDTVTATFAYLQELINDMSETTLPDNGKAYDDLGTKVNAFNNDALTPLTQQQTDAAQETENHKTKMNELSIEASNDISVLNNYAAAVNEIASAMGAAAEAAGSFINAMSNIPTVAPSFDIPSIPSATPSVAPSFFASGGLVDGPYIGRDNIPAMLMPGEFVVRRKAAQLLGKNFLQNLNSMNIPAAVDALMRGVNLPMNHGIVAYDNHRNYDNHATVNQYFDKSVNPAFTYRRASRFVGAL